MKKITVTLPKAAEYNAAENCAENLRINALGCVPVGLPKQLLANAGTYTQRVGSRLLSVAADGKTLSLDGREAGTLSGCFLSALADGNRTIIFTDAGIEWLQGDALEGASPQHAGVAFSAVQSSQTLTAEVTPPSKLSGSYTRTNEALQADDCRAMVAPVESALNQLSASAALRGMLTQPAWVAWRMTDADGRVVAQSEPIRFGRLQGAAPLSFAASKSGSTVSVSGTASLSVSPYSLKLSIPRSNSAFWRRFVRNLEVILWPDCVQVAGTSGHLNADSLTVTPQLAEPSRQGSGIIAARVALPLEGATATLFLDNLGDAADSEMTYGNLPVSIVHCAGTINAYALNGEPGVIAVAPAADPLRLKVKTKICRGDILRICSPAGSAGGWNYGRHHLLAFATDGVYAVSVDSSMTRIAASLICSEGVSRSDAVGVAPDCIYFATSTGNLLRLKGSRVEPQNLPLVAEAVCWSAPYGELWVMIKGGPLYAMTADKLLTRRSIITADRFVEPAMAVDYQGVLRNLAEEESVAVAVKWCRRMEFDSKGKEHRVAWHIDAQNSVSLLLGISLDCGGAPQRALQLSVDGPINAPLTATFRAPRRSHLTASLAGLLQPPARLSALALH
ncbi:MAG: hypothetical protein NC301_02390 [Bacteroides sp.]|nr:hypothetical protein [Bacteroides sp.]MCM1379115.1 hypothetical protein [Bacteroides sp.]MCM1445813.1 hypothetical protein [Prevotella sp.]